MAFARASSIEVEIYRDMKGLHSSFCIIFKFKGVLSAPFLTTHTPNNLLPSRTMKKNAQTFPIIELQFFSCMNCIPSIRFHRQRALSITGNRRRYVSRPNNSCKEDNVKRGTDAFYFCAEDF